MSIPHINLNTTLGAVFVGNIVAAALFGITTLQTFIFFNKNTRDRKLFKQLIAFLWLMDLVHLVFMTHGVYRYLISNFCNFSAFERPTWSLLSQVLITCISDFIVRCVFARRIWLLSEHNTVLLLVIVGTVFFTVSLFSGSLNRSEHQVVTSTFVFGTGIAFAARGFIDMSYVKLIMESWLLYTALSGSVLADGFITASLCTLLYQNRTGFKSTDSLVNTLMLYSINTGLLTSVCATACFVTFAIWPHQFVFICIYFTLGKLYVNSLLAVLNTRETLRKRNSGMTTIPLSPSSIEPLTMNFVMSTTVQTSVTSSPTVAKPQPPKLAWHDSKWK